MDFILSFWICVVTAQIVWYRIVKYLKGIRKPSGVLGTERDLVCSGRRDVYNGLRNTFVFVTTSFSDNLRIIECATASRRPAHRLSDTGT